MAEPAAPSRKTGASPVPGCYILILLLCLIAGVGVWAIYTFYKQSELLSTFTAEAPARLPVRNPTPEEVSQLRSRLSAFAAEAGRGEQSTLVISVDDLNTLFGGFEQFASLREHLVWQGIDEHQRLVAQISLPMNSLPGQRVYLNGELYARLGVHPDAGIYIAADDLKVPGKEVPPGFVDVYKRGIVPGKTFGFIDDMLLRNFRSDPEISKILRRVSDVQIKDNLITIQARAAPRAAPPPRQQ